MVTPLRSIALSAVITRVRQDDLFDVPTATRGGSCRMGIGTILGNTLGRGLVVLTMVVAFDTDNVAR